MDKTIIAVKGRHRIFIEVLPTHSLYYFADETEQLQGGWLTLAEAEAQRDAYARSL